jgi:hypothetical protein
LNDIAALAVTDGNIIVGDGTNWVAESGATARTSLGLGNVENTALSTWAGTNNITTLGTIGTGTWQGTAIAPTYGGTGVDASGATNGQLLVGNGTGFTLATISGTANQVNVANGAGSITLSTPQDIHTGATPTFGGLTLSGNLNMGANNVVSTGAATFNSLTISNLAGATTGGTLTIDGSGVFSTSDRRYKENIVPLNSALEQISRVEGVKYNYKADDASQIHFGVIAQDIEKIFPNLVKTNDKGYKSVNYIELVPMLLEAIKEQQSTIDRLHKQLINGDRQVMQTEKALADQGEMLGMQKMLVSTLQQHILQLQQENLSMLKDLNDIKQHLGLDFKSQK